MLGSRPRDAGEYGMPKTRGTGLLMVWTDIDAEFEPEFNRWYDEEHLPRLLHISGVFERRPLFCNFKGDPKYLAIYELEDHNVLRSSAYLDPGSNTSHRAQRQKTGTSRIGRNFQCNAYRADLSGAHPSDRADRGYGRTGVADGADRRFRRGSRRSSTPGTTPLTFRAIWRCRAAWRRAATSLSRASRNTWTFTNSNTPRSRRARLGPAQASQQSVDSGGCPQFLRHDAGSPGVYQRIYPK